MVSSHHYFYNSPLGLLKIEANSKAITAVMFSDEENNSDSFPNELTKLCCTQLNEYFNNNRKTFELPLAQPGTEFQQKVWMELQKIPYGKTVSYAYISNCLQNPGAIRAVGAANGRNNLAIIIPCHRVIGSDGTLVGYAGGLWRKKWLLKHEGFNIGGEQQALF